MPELNTPFWQTHFTVVGIVFRFFVFFFLFILSRGLLLLFLQARTHSLLRQTRSLFSASGRHRFRHHSQKEQGVPLLRLFFVGFAPPQKNKIKWRKGCFLVISLRKIATPGPVTPKLDTVSSAVPFNTLTGCHGSMKYIEGFQLFRRRAHGWLVFLSGCGTGTSPPKEKKKPWRFRCPFCP